MSSWTESSGPCVRSQDMIENVLDIKDTYVREVMTPLVDVVAIDAAAPLMEFRNLWAKQQYSRIPVYKGRVDNIVGIAYAMDMLDYIEQVPFFAPPQLSVLLNWERFTSRIMCASCRIENNVDCRLLPADPGRADAVSCSHMRRRFQPAGWRVIQSLEQQGYSRQQAEGLRMQGLNLCQALPRSALNVSSCLCLPVFGRSPFACSRNS